MKAHQNQTVRHPYREQPGNQLVVVQSFPQFPGKDMVMYRGAVNIFNSGMNNN